MPEGSVFINANKCHLCFCGLHCLVMKNTERSRIKWLFLVQIWSYHLFLSLFQNTSVNLIFTFRFGISEMNLDRLMLMNVNMNEKWFITNLARIWIKQRHCLQPTKTHYSRPNHQSFCKHFLRIKRSKSDIAIAIRILTIQNL